MKKYYEFKFENGVIYYGTVADKNTVFTEKERKQMGKIVTKIVKSRDFVEAWRAKSFDELRL